jgi:hypothetical protein
MKNSETNANRKLEVKLEASRSVSCDIWNKNKAFVITIVKKISHSE